MVLAMRRVFKARLKASHTSQKPRQGHGFGHETSFKARVGALHKLFL